MGLITGIALAATMAATAYAASEQAGAQEEANEANLRNAQETNRLNLEMFRESRGSEGSAVLPLYLKRADGSMMEESLGKRAMDIYDATSVLPETEIAANQELVRRFAPMQQQANETAMGLFNGALEREAGEALEPVLQARTEGVAARKQAGLEGLQATLNEIQAVQAGKGYSGDSFGNRLLSATVRRKVLTDAATDAAVIKEKNSADKYGLKEKAIGLKLSNLSLPYTMARQSLETKNLAKDAALDAEKRRQSIFDYFRIAPGRFTYSPLPQVQPVASTGQIVAQSLGALAGGVGNYYAAKDIAGSMAPATGRTLNTGVGIDYDPSRTGSIPYTV